MNIKKFIDRPLLSIVINVMVVAVGIIALTRLPIEKFPDIAPPTVYLWASYPGASAETVQKSVLAPLRKNYLLPSITGRGKGEGLLFRL